MGIRHFVLAPAIALASLCAPAVAQNCDTTYTVQSGDTLSGIAERVYRDIKQWRKIHNDNIEVIGTSPTQLAVGMKIDLRCLDADPKPVVAETPTPEKLPKPLTDVSLTSAPSTTADTSAAAPRNKILLVTGDDFAPFTDRSLENNGLLADVVNRAMAAAVGADGYEILWVNDWASHLASLLPAGAMEMAFPWSRPNCESDPAHDRCQSYHFSKPIFEYLVLMYVDRDRPILFENNRDMAGRKLCRPEGYPNHMLDDDGRNWLRDGKIILVQPRLVRECFQQLADGSVDGVVLNEFTARDALFTMGLADQIVPIDSNPVSVTALHVLVSKSNPNAVALLDTINRGLDAIKESGQYRKIVSRHMTSIWAGYQVQ